MKFPSPFSVGVERVTCVMGAREDNSRFDWTLSVKDGVLSWPEDSAVPAPMHALLDQLPTPDKVL